MYFMCSWFWCYYWLCELTLNRVLIVNETGIDPVGTQCGWIVFFDRPHTGCATKLEVIFGIQFGAMIAPNHPPLPDPSHQDFLSSLSTIFSTTTTFTCVALHSYIQTLDWFSLFVFLTDPNLVSIPSSYSHAKRYLVGRMLWLKNFLLSNQIKHWIWFQLDQLKVQLLIVNGFILWRKNQVGVWIDIKLVSLLKNSSKSMV